MRISLQNARREKNLTQQAVSNYLGMIKQAYGKIEYGTRGTSETNWIKLFNLFDGKVPLQELMKNTI